MKFRVRIETNRCKGCEICIASCPKNVLAMSRALGPSGNRIAEVIAPESCIGCLRCARMCPDAAIEIDRETGP